MAITVIIIIIVLIIIIAVGAKQKKSTNINMTQNTFSHNHKEPSADALYLAHEYFGEQWQSLLNSQDFGTRLPVRFYETIALAMENLDSEEHKKLLTSFLQLDTTPKSGQVGISISVGWDNYEELHLATFNLLRSDTFSVISVTNALKHIVEAKRKEPVENQVEKIDHSIIDVTGKSYQIPNQPTNDVDVPYWSHQYVYSYSELNYATTQQKQFYGYFKDKFLNGVYLDVKGYSNYYFILLFDLLEDYGKHKDILKVEKQLVNLGNNYPLTKRYLAQFLQRKMREIGEEDKIDLLEERESSIFQILIDESLLGYRYKKKLNLSKQEAAWLNKFSNQTNSFLSIEGCCLATSRLYLAALKAIQEQLNAKGLTVTDEIKSLQAFVIEYYKNNNLYYFGSGSNDSYLAKQVETEVFKTIFQRSENAIRNLFGHKRKISPIFLYSDSNIQSEFAARFGDPLLNAINESINLIEPPDEKTEIELNSQNTSRWKIKLEELENSFAEEKKQSFIDGVQNLEKTNQKNPAIENIFFEASKFISKFDKTTSLRFYVTYLFYDLRSAKVDNKQLTKTIQKNLFKTNEQLHDFEKIVADLVKTKNLKSALTEVDKIYQPKRKKINLDSKAITEVQTQDRGTVEKLEEYLKDEYEDENTKIKTEEVNNEEIRLEIVEKLNGLAETRKFAQSILLNEIQIAVLKLFTENSLSVAFIDMDNFCKSKGVFRNQVIESINDSCYETLDDILIDEEDESYIINEGYYKKIILNND